MKKPSDHPRLLAAVKAVKPATEAAVDEGYPKFSFKHPGYDATAEQMQQYWAAYKAHDEEAKRWHAARMAELALQREQIIADIKRLDDALDALLSDPRTTPSDLVAALAATF